MGAEGVPQAEKKSGLLENAIKVAKLGLLGAGAYALYRLPGAIEGVGTALQTGISNAGASVGTGVENMKPFGS